MNAKFTDNQHHDLEQAARAAEIAAVLWDDSPSGLTITKLSGDASSRSYYRIANAVSGNGNASKTLVAALYPAQFDETETAYTRLGRLEAVNPLARLSFANDPCAQIETTRVFIGGGLPAPEILSVSGKDKLILFEDVGDTRLQDWLASASAVESLEAYQKAIDFIISIQELTDHVNEPGSMFVRLAFDQAKLKAELDFFSQHYFSGYLKHPLEPETNRQMENDFNIICGELAEMPRVLTHRDYHARNLMIHQDQVIIIDHQDARLGPDTYDLVSLLYDPYSGLDHDSIESLQEYFIRKKNESKLKLARHSEFKRSVRLAAAQRMLKAVGTFAFQSSVKKNLVYVQYIRPAMTSAIENLKELGGFDHLVKLLTSTIE